MDNHVKSELKKEEREYVKNSPFAAKLFYYTGALVIVFKDKHFDGKYRLTRKLRAWHPLIWLIIFVVAVLYFLDGLYDFFKTVVPDFMEIDERTVKIKNGESEKTLHS